MILLDTHTLFWWTTAPEYLSSKARKRIEKEITKGRVLVSSFSVWEVYMLVKKGRIKFSIDVDTWLSELEESEKYEFIPLNNTIAARSVTLPELTHKDPADRFILATAREHGAILITSDKQLRKYPHVQTLW